ncbi:hypothetical protein KA071_00615 [Candidatus Gracilibacteria bacterium]|jgi:hypothetical protein|nr:hypothetical protein [Candidatus Gracilibacteria bacterium]
MKTPILSLVAAVGLSSCVAPGGTNIGGSQINMIAYPVHRAVGLLPLEMTPEQVVEYERLKMQEAERNRQLLDGRVNNVRGW